MIITPAIFNPFDPVGEIASMINEVICKALVSIANFLFQGYYGIIKALTNSSYISGGLSKLFGNEEVWKLVKDVHSAAVVPIGEGILGLFMLIQLVKISQRIDATATLPAVKDIVFLFVTYVIMHWLIIHSLDLATATYDVINKITTNAALSPSSALDKSPLDFGAADDSDIDWSKASIGGCFMLVLFGGLSFFVGGVAFLIGLVMALARGIQLYMYAAFAPIPLSLLGFDETRQSGISFIKNFISLCLAGAIMIFSLVAYPKILTAVATSGFTDNVMVKMMMGGSSVDSLRTLLTGLAVTILLCLALVKSGAWAKEILGS